MLLLESKSRKISLMSNPETLNQSLERLILCPINLVRFSLFIFLNLYAVILTSK